MSNRCHPAATLNTDMVEPLYTLERTLLGQCQAIKNWFEREWQRTRPPVYGSVDLRNAGFKLAPIDMNLFPAGFNNLNPDHFNLSVAAAQKAIKNWVPEAKKILLIPEAHTRNLFYWSNIATLTDILEKAGFDVRLGSFDDAFQTAQTITLPEGRDVSVLPIKREGNHLSLDGFHPDVLLLNNDLSGGIPPILQQLAQPLLPPPELGWGHRLKSTHFQHYAAVVQEFASAMGVNPWLMAPLFRSCDAIDFMSQTGMDELIQHASDLFAEIEAQYQAYGIKQQPFLVVKADAGTYGMAVMTVRHIDELKSMNRKQRTRMATTKGNQPVRNVIIQEGVYTVETVGEDQAVAEPVVYLWGSEVVGGFYRVHKDKGIDESLNAPGMAFQPLAFEQTCNKPDVTLKPDACCNRFFIYGVIARLSMLAAAREMTIH